MSTNVEYLIKRRELLDQAIERKILEEERFGVNADYEQGCILVIRYRFVDTKVYTYIAAKFGASWYTTSRFDNNTWRKVMTWDQLVDVLGRAESVKIVTQVEEL